MRKLIMAGLMIAMLIITACGAAENAGGSGSPSAAGTAVHGELTVLAAASLTESFTTIGEQFERANPGVTVRFSFGSSSTLATQVTQGAPADVFASASATTMKTVTDADAAGTQPTIFVTNTLRIAVPQGNPADVTGLDDFADPDNKTALCAEQVPCGTAARQVFEDAGITPTPVTYEQDVKAALQKVVQGEVDAAMVYATDVVAAGDDVEGIDFDGSDAVVNSYPIATLKESANANTAEAFVDYVTSDAGQQVLQQAGFGSP